MSTFSDVFCYPHIFRSNVLVTIQLLFGVLLSNPILKSSNFLFAGCMEREVAHLKRELAKTSKMLDDARRSSKTMKEQLEDKIYSELGKTHEVLAKTQRNFKKAQI